MRVALFIGEAAPARPGLGLRPGLPVTRRTGPGLPQRHRRRPQAQPALAGSGRTPPVKGVGEPCAGEPHARFDGRGLETERDRVTAPVPDPTHLVCQLWDHLRVVRRLGCGLPLAITSSLMAWRSRVAFREVRVNEVREVLRCWLAGDGLRIVGASGPGWTARPRAATWRRRRPRVWSATAASGS